MKPFKFPGLWWSIFLATGLGLLLAAAIRYGVLENEAQASLCETAQGGWCALRSAIGWSIYMQAFGLAALALGVAAWWPPLRRLAWPALFLAGCGLFIYNSTYAAVALVLALLASLRTDPAA